MFTWELRAEAITTATPADIWKVWTDVSAWPKWDHDLEWARLDGPFTAGTNGELKPKGWFSSKFQLIAVEKNKHHSDKTAMPLTQVIFHHSIVPHDPYKIRVVHHIKATGLLAPLLYFTMRKKLQKGLPEAVERLVKLAETTAKTYAR